MKILFFSKVFANPTLTFIYNEVEYLSNLGHNVKVVTLERRNETIFPYSNVETLPKHSKIENRIRHILQSNDFEFGFRNASFKLKFKKIVEDFKPDIIHTHFGFESWHFFMNFSETKIPIILTLHGFDVSHKLNSKRYCKTLNKVLLRKDTFPIFVSKFSQNHVAKILGKWYTSSVIYCGIDLNTFKRVIYKNVNAEIVFIQISSFAEKKGHEYTIFAFSQLLQKTKLPLKLILAGEGECKTKIENIVKENKLEDKVKFAGLVDKRKASELMENANYFVHHSVTSKIGDTEGIPTALMEAMAMELPVISTYHSGIPELVEDGVNGLLVKERDIEAYANAMEKILSWGYLPENRKKIEKYFEKEKHGALLESYYKEAIELMKKKQE